MWISEGDESKTTMVTRYDLFEYLIMSFGLANASTTFCNLINDVLYEYLDKFVVYLDDTVIYSKSFEDHMGHLRKFFEKLKSHSLYVKNEKYTVNSVGVKLS